MRTNSTAAETADSHQSQQSEQPASKQIKDPKQTDVLETYKKVKLLGKGAHGKAFLVQCGSDSVSLSCNRLTILEPGSNQEDRHKKDEPRGLARDLPRGQDS